MRTSGSSFLERRIDPGTTPLAVGDVLVLALIVAFGVVSHSSVDVLFANPVGWLGALLPFLVGWAVVAPLVGAYSPGAGESSKAAIPLAVRSWVGADVVGIVIRGIVNVGSTLVGLAIFFTVMLVVGAVGLGLWRYLYFKVR